MTKFNVGDKVRFVGSRLEFNEDVTKGEVYAIEMVDDAGYAYFVDDAEETSFISDDKEHLFELVDESAQQTPVPSLSPELADLLANMSRRLYEVEQAIKPAEAQVDEHIASDNVNHPSHYTKGKHETIDIIEHITSGYTDTFVAYCVGNTTKYIDRAPYKHGSPVTDLKKAAWYLTKAADYLDGK